MRFSAHPYQRQALEWLFQRTVVDGHEGAGLFQDPGLGKTVQTLAWFNLLRKANLAKRALIVSPLRVTYSVWPREVPKWDQFRHLETSIIHGPLTKRLAALSSPAEISCVNTDGVKWLQEHYNGRKLPWDVLVIDESSPFKNWGSQRTKALRKLVPKFKKRLILTGTPSPNCIHDLFSQIFVVDQGESLGNNVTAFRNRYFYRGGFKGYKWIPHATASAAIQKKIQPLCLQMSAADHLDIPELVVNDVWVRLPPKAQRQYKQMEKELFLELSNGTDLTPMNAGAKYVYCRQIANGGIYEISRRDQKLLSEQYGVPVKNIPISSAHIHDAKIEAAAEIIGELQGKPVMVPFQFDHDLKRIRKFFPDVRVIDGNCSARKADQIVHEWNQGKIPILAVQPQSLSHGVNMQSSGLDIVWLGLTDNLEHYLQLNARIHRQGVRGTVRVHRILADGTVDEMVRNRIETKDENQRGILDSLNRYRTAMAG